MKLGALLTLGALAAAAAAGCGGNTSVDSSTIGYPSPTPPGSPTPTPTPTMYTVRVTFISVHVFADGDAFGNGELYGTLAVNDQVEYTSEIITGNPSDFSPGNYGISPIEVQVQEGNPFYIYSDFYDQNLNNNNSNPLGTVNTGWYAGTAMVGVHTVAAQNPYHYDLTYQIDIL